MTESDGTIDGFAHCNAHVAHLRGCADCWGAQFPTAAQAAQRAGYFIGGQRGGGKTLGLSPRVEHGETLYTQMQQVQQAPTSCTPECAQQTRELAVCACILAIGTLLIGAVFGWALHAVMHGGGVQ